MGLARMGIAVAQILDRLGITEAGVYLGPQTVAAAPAATTAGRVAYFSDGAAGQPVLAFSNGTNWLRCDTSPP